MTIGGKTLILSIVPAESAGEISRYTVTLKYEADSERTYRITIDASSGIEVLSYEDDFRGYFASMMMNAKNVCEQIAHFHHDRTITFPILIPNVE